MGVLFGGGMRAAMMAFALVVCGAGTASADDFIKECKVGVMDPSNADKICNCMDGKIKGADRTAVIATMKKTNEALTKGTGTAAMTPADMKAAEVAMTAQTQCM
jgi:hypothetical protein